MLAKTMGQDKEKEWRFNSGCYQSDSSFDESISSTCSYTNEEKIFYGVYIPSEAISGTHKFEQNVFTDKAEAMRFVKQNQGARFRAFPSESEAADFSKSGGEVIVAESPSCANERSLYKEPKSQELIRFRKAIENHDLSYIQKSLDENPRYLVGSGDTPTILQEGFRYNALHISARSYSANICSYILSVISDTRFFSRLYGQNNTNIQERLNVLVDLYLNMPDKGLNETPLHFASKLGALEIVKILTSYPQCDKLRRNKNNLTASDIVCSRSPNKIYNKEEILKYLDTQYFIPVLRSSDNSLPPVIGEPFTNSNPPKIDHGRITPPLEVRAVAGPMSEEQARVFRKKWKTPPRVSDSPHLRQRPELSDPEKGLEKVGRILAHEFSVEWKEYWPFLNSFHDLSSFEGLTALENYLAERFKQLCNEKSLCEYNLNKRNGFFSLQRVNRTFINEQSNKNPLVRDLAEEFSKMCLNETPKTSERVKSKHISPSASGEFNDYMNEFDASNDSTIFQNGYQHTSHLRTATMENSCQVFASRIGFSIVQGMRSSVMTEITRFQDFLASSKADNRFTAIDFSKCHYRLAALICNKILSITEERNTVVTKLNEITNVEDFDYKEKNNISAAHCIIEYVKAILLSQSFPQNIAEFPPNDSQDPSQLLWNVAKSCKCILPILNKKAHAKYVPRMLFNDGKESVSEGEGPTTLCNDNNEEFLNENHNDRRNVEDSSDEEFSDEDYFTAPNSPELLSSDEEDNHMLQTETGPDVYLTGREPTKIDKAVLDVLENTSIPLKSFSHIMMWRHACKEHAIKKPQEKWPTPRPERPYTRNYFNSC